MVVSSNVPVLNVRCRVRGFEHLGVGWLVRCCKPADMLISAKINQFQVHRYMLLVIYTSYNTKSESQEDKVLYEELHCTLNHYIFDIFDNDRIVGKNTGLGYSTLTVTGQSCCHHEEVKRTNKTYAGRYC